MAEKLLSVNVDDAGIIPDQAEGIVALWKAGVISSTSVIAYGDDFGHTAKVLKAAGVPVGVHLGLNHGKGVLPASEVPSLHGPDGNFYDTVAETLSHMSLEEAGREFEAQIRKTMEAGLEPKHLDSHMGLLFMTKELLGLYRDLALRYRLAAGLPAGAVFDGAREAVRKAGPGASDSLDGVYTLPGGAEENPENRIAAYGKYLSTLGPGRHYIYTHPSPPTDAVRKAFADADIRFDDYEVLLSPSWKEILAERNIRIAYFSESV